MLDNNRKLRVFICHASQDKSIVRELYQRLLAEGWIDPWLDEEKLLPGQDWDMEIEKTVRSADAVIVCLSNSSVSKEGYIQKELRKILDVAQEKPEGSIFVIPLRLADCQVPRSVEGWQYSDYFPEDRRNWAYDRILTSLDIKAKYLGNITSSELKIESRLTRFRDLILSGITVTPMLDEESVLNKISKTAKEVLNARFVVVSVIDQDGKTKRSAFEGHAPELVNYLARTSRGDKLFQVINNSDQAIRMLDIHKLDPEITLDNSDLRNFIGVPLRLHKMAIGSILGFGTNQKPYFSEEDEVLAMLLGIQACTAIESTWLYKELRSNLNNTMQLNQLGMELTQAGDTRQAIDDILSVALNISNASSAGVILYTNNNEIEIDFEMDKNGNHTSGGCPMDMVQMVYDSGNSIYSASEQGSLLLGYPLQTHLRKYGVLWLNILADSFSRRTIELQAIMTLAAQAIERLMLIEKYKSQAKK